MPRGGARNVRKQKTFSEAKKPYKKSSLSQQGMMKALFERMNQESDPKFVFSLGDNND